MATKENILSELEGLNDEDLEELYTVIRQFLEFKRAARPRTLMEALQEIQIEAPPDFAANLDLYLSGEKSV